MLTSFSFTKRYLLALGIIAMLSTLAYFNLNHMIERQVDDGKLINISGRQRMLSQKIALYAIYYKTKHLYKNIALMEKSHKFLTSREMSEELRKLYYDKPIELDKKVKEYLFHAKRFYETHDGRSLNYVLKHSQMILGDLNRAVSIYQKEAEVKTRKLKQVEYYIFLMTLVTLFFEALFIFMPANRSINRKTKELIAEKEYSETVIESSANAIIALDKENVVHTYNKMAEKIFGFSKSEMIGKDSLKKIIPTQYHRLHDEGLKRFLQTGELKHKGEVLELSGRNKDGKEFPVRIYFGKTGGKSKVAIVANIQDISKEKLKDSIVQQQSKFAALGEMIAIIAHQWRQPLAQLNFNCMYIRKRLKDDELKQEIAKNEEIIAFMSETITSFEDFYKKSESELFRPEQSINQALRLLESLIKINQIEVIRRVESEAVLYGSVNALAQVVLSVVQNMVDVIRQREVQNPRIVIEVKEGAKGCVQMQIADNAGGICVEPIEEIFEPFKSKKRKPSTGIGLYMARLVLEEKFKGKITAKNGEEGAIFTIRLPKSGQSRTPVSPPS